ncbi:Uncharacterised protein [Yersinia rohdei]|uniref:hypothetical protein n=1 Tax=Yersinia rohdei TaxID=29485 RepID=UPI00061C5F8E|nr:hypothetical protein [Yersinia rohdei]CNF16496.1 Uncharacterised protein [Yersinia rohdei]
MKKRFAVAIDSSTPEGNDAFIEFIRENGLGWWHWIENFWMISDRKGKLSASDIRDKIGEIYPGINTIVIELSEDGDTWSGYGPKKENKSMFTWLRNNWKKS